MTPPTSDVDLLLQEDWNHTRNSRVYTLKVWTPKVDPTFASGTFVVWRQVVNLDDVPRPHVQISPALAIHDAIHFAVWGELVQSCAPAPSHASVGSKEPPAPESRSFLDEPWEGVGRYRLRVWNPQLDPAFAPDPFAWFQVVGLDPEPRPHHQISGALAIQNAIHVAVRDLLLAGAHPVADP